MKTLALVLLILATNSFAHQFEVEDDVLVLHDSDFNTALEHFDFLMAEFYAPWCGHCKKLAPEYTKAAGILKEKTNIALAKIDATVEKNLAEEFEIKGFPTVLFFSKASGKTGLPYEGPRVAADIVSYINKKSGPASVQVSSLEELERLTTNPKIPAVVFFGSEDDEFKVFSKVALQFNGAEFFHTSEHVAREHFRLTDNEKVVLFKNFEERKNVFTESPIQELPLLGFVTANSSPSVVPFGDSIIQSVFQQGNTGIFLFANDAEESNQALEVFSAVAPLYKEQFRFSFSKPNDASGLFTRLAEFVGASSTKLPNIMITAPGQNNAKYRFEKEITTENLREFLDQVVAGTYPKYVKSEEIPATNNEPVKVVVGKNFNDLVLNNDADVLVEFYAPWCGHCKQLAPIYTEVAVKLQHNKKIVIAKCDATLNEIPGVEIQSFPTLKFWKNGQKTEPIPFSGDRTLEGILKFLENNTSHPWNKAPEVSDDL